MRTDLPTPDSALVIVAHPDDAEFQCGATLAKWADAGSTLHYVVCTDGSKGTWDPHADQRELVLVRQAEQRAAAAVLGAAGEVVFLGHVDGELDSGPAVRSQVAYEIRRLRPHVVLGHDPWKRYRLHPDHRHAGRLAVEGCVAARDPFFFPDHDRPAHRPQVLLLFEPDEANHAESAVGWDDRKVAALLVHESQFAGTHDIADPDDPAQVRRFADWVRAALAAGGEQAGLASAELFHAVEL